MRKLKIQFLKAISLLLVMLASLQVNAQNSLFNFTIENEVQMSDRILEFDLYLLDADAGATFELAAAQAGIIVNPGIYNGGTITPSVVSGFSQLSNVSQQPTSLVWDLATNAIKLTPKAPPGAGSGSILSQTTPGTRLCRIRITNTVAFTTNSTADLTFNFTTVPYPTKVAQYVSGTNTVLTCDATNCFSNSNIILNPPIPDVPIANPGSGATCSQITANWSAAANALSYRLDVSTSNTFGTFVSGFQDLNVGNVTTYPVTGLTAGNTYYYRLRAANTFGTSGNSNVITYATSPAAPATPGAITGTTPQCAGSTGLVYSIGSVTNASTYNWTVPTGWAITSGSGTVSITVTAGSAGQNGNISVTAGNSCGTSSARNLAVTVASAPGTPGVISGNTTQCPGLTGQVYSIGSVANATTYTWTVPLGWAVTNGAGTTSITVTAGSTGQNGNISVTAGNSCGTSSASNLAVTVGIATPATPGAITGISAQCSSQSGQTYSISSVTNATTYTWAVPTGWTVTSGAGTTSITVTTGSAGQNGNISVTAGNTCGTSFASTLAVTVISAPATPGTITGTTSQCASLAGQVYSISSVAGATTYTWTVPTGWSITAGTGTTSITVTTGSAGQNGNIGVTAGNGCGNSSQRTLAVTVTPGAPATPGSITGTATQCANLTGQIYSIGSVANASTYTWSVPTGWNITAGAGSTSITVTTGSAGQNGNISVTAGNGCGTSSPSTLAVTVNPATPATPGAISGTASQCAGMTGQIYSIGSVINATTYTWTVPAGWSITAGAGTTSITVTTGSAGQNGNISVTAGNSCGTSTPSTLAVTVNPATPSTPGAITGTSAQCAGISGQIYSIASVLNATTYTWTVPAGWSVTAGAGTTSITVTTGSAGQNGNISVTAGNGCGTSSASTLAVTITASPLAPTIGTITQPSCLLATGSVDLSGLPAIGTWTLTRTPGGITTLGTGVSTTITGLASGTYTYTVTNATGCTSPASANVIINSQPVTPVIGAQTTSATPGVPFLYTPTGGTIPAGTTYTWPVPSYTGGVTGGAASIGSQTTINGTLNIPSGTGTAIYTVTPTSLAVCTGTTFTVTVTVTSACVPVTVSTQPSNATACATSGTATFTVVATGTGPFTYQWQYYNGASFVNVVNGTPTGAVYTNAATASMIVTGITAPSIYQYHCTITNCSGGNTTISNTATFTVLALPVPTLSSSDPDNTFCIGTSVTFTAGGGGVGGTYDFRVQGITVQTGLVATYTTTSLGNGQVVTVNVTNAAGCSATSAGISNFVNQPPYIIGVPTTTCSTDFTTYTVGITVSAGIVTSTSGIVTNTSGNVWSISGILAGVNVTLTITDISGCVFTQPITAPNCNCPLVLPPVSGGDRSYCSGGIIPALTATVLAGETVDWYNTSSGGTPIRSGSLIYTPTAPGQYYALARNTSSNCISGTRTLITLTMNPLPVPTLTSSDADNIFCAGTSITFTATGGTSYTFFVGGVAQPGISATYTTNTLTNGQAVNVLVTNANGCTATAGPITNTVNPTPIPTLTSSDADNIFCAGTSITFTAGGGATYDFRVGGISMQNGASTTYTTSLLTNGQVVNVIVSNANGCSATSPGITNTVNPIPTPTLTSSDADNIFCAGTSVIFTAGGGTNYNFRVGGVSVQNSTSNTYTTTFLTNGLVVNVIVSNSVGCSLTSAGITNTVNPQPTANAGAGGDVCGLSFNLSAHASIGIGTWTKTTGTGTATFTPNASSPSATVTVSEYGTYTFTWTEVSGSCTSSSVAIVNFYLQPVANAGTGGNNCGTGFRFNATLNAGIGTWTKVTGPGTVIFSPDANTATALATVSAFGSYTFRWSVDNGTCSNSSTVAVVFIQAAAANAGSGGNSCDKTFTLGALVPATSTGTWTKSVGPGNATFAPDNHNAGAKVTVDQFGTYIFAWTVVNSTCSSSDIVQVVFHNLPPINAGRDTALCKGGSVQLHAVGTGTVSWTPVVLVSNPNIINPTVTPDTTTIFTVNLTDQFGCKNSDNIVVEVRDKIVADAGPDQVLGYAFSTTMNANLGHTYETGVWSLISGTGKFSDSTFAKTEVNSLSAGENKFLWTVKNGYCPVSHDSVSIKVNDFVIPTLITPNMDGKNDYFVLRGLTTTLGKTELIIFDRRGAMVYKNLNYDNLWNGVDYNKNPLPDDTYFYVIKTSSGKSISGYIVIRR